MKRFAVTAVLLAATALGLVNVYGDISSALQAAERLACGQTPCVRLLRTERTPLRQQFTFQTSLSPAATRSIECRRSLVLVGDYACQLVP